MSAEHLQIGDPAPEFSLDDSNGTRISLNEYLGKKKIVLYFYPRDNTPGCTKEACSFRDFFPSIENENTIIFGISPDTIQSHLKFIAKFNLNFILLSDSDHKVAELYGAWGEKKLYGKTSMGIIRKTFIIDMQGKIAKIYHKVKPENHGEEVLNELKKI